MFELKFANINLDQINISLQTEFAKTTKLLFQQSKVFRQNFHVQTYFVG